MEPSPETWQRLYKAALQFQSAAPWDWMWDSDQFGVRDPESGEIGYCAVMGRLGEHYALAVYQGSEGLAGLWRLRMEGPHDDPMAVLTSQHCLMASFEDRAILTKRDLDQIKALGLKFRGKNAWPQFRSYLPGYQPWYLTSAEASFLTVALEQAIDVTERFRQKPALLPRSEPRGRVLVRVPESGRSGLTWRDSLQTPAPIAPMKGPPVRLDDIRIQRIKRTLPKSRSVVELDYFYLPNAVRGERGERPYFPYVILGADPASGMILAMSLVKPDELASQLVTQTLDVCEQMGSVPAAIQVAHEEARTYLEPVTTRLGIRLSKARRLKAIDNARKGLSAHLGLDY